jgi:hypothetical protein
VPLSKKVTDYEAFLRLVDEARERHPIRLLGYCAMPNIGTSSNGPKAIAT